MYIGTDVVHCVAFHQLHLNTTLAAYLYIAHICASNPALLAACFKTLFQYVPREEYCPPRRRIMTTWYNITHPR
jgi:hypothetical protein